MTATKTLISALRALSSIPNLEPNELKTFSDSVDENCPLPDASYGADPVWRLNRAEPVAEFFQPLMALVEKTTGLVVHEGYIALSLPRLSVVVTEPTLRTIIDQISQTQTTAAEFRLALQLLEGHDLKQAAALDEIGYETKRSQFKSLSSKLSLTRQSDVVRVLTTLVVRELSELALPSAQSDLEIYAASYLPETVRRMTLHSRDGTIVPVLEYGPVSGAPLVILHPMIFPPIGEREVAQAYDLNVRLIWPLRPGLLDQSAPILKSAEYIAKSVDGLSAVLTKVVGGSAPIVAFVSSGAVATRMARRRPDLVRSISFVATCYSAGKSSFNLPYFGAELAELAFRSEAIMTRTVAALRKYVASDQRFQKMCESIFRGSKPDLEHVRREFESADEGARFRQVTLQSPEAIRHDFFNQTAFKWSELSELDVPRRFLQGGQDSIHPPEKLSKILNKLGESDLNVANGMGHLPHFSDLRESIRFAADWQIER